MSWRNIKIFALAILIVLNGLFLWLVSNQFVTMGKFTDEEIDNVIKILDNGNIHVEKSLINQEKISPNAYKGKLEFSKLLDIWDNVYSNVSNELNVISGRSREGKVSIDTELDFNFISIIRPGEYSFDDSLFENTGFDPNYYLDSFNTAVFGEKFFDYVKVKLTCVGLYTDEDGLEYVKFRQTYDSNVINEGDINCVFVGGKLIYAEGFLLAIAPNNTISTNCVDILSILVKENGRIKTETNDEKTIVNIVNGLSYVKTKDTFYLVPTYRIIYADTNESVYDAITGEYLGS